MWIVQLGNINNDIATAHATTDCAYTSLTAYAPRKSTASARWPSRPERTGPAAAAATSAAADYSSNIYRLVTPRLRNADIIQRDIILRVRAPQHCCSERPEAIGSLPVRMGATAVVVVSFRIELT